MTVVHEVDDLRVPLAGWLAARLRVDEVRIGGIMRPGGGQSNDTVVFEAEWNERGLPHHEVLVLRRQPTTNHIFRAPDVLREFRVLAGLASSWVPVPRVRWSEATSSPR